MAVKSIVILLPAAWLCCGEPTYAQIPPGFELVQITSDDDYERNAELNNCGQVVFSKIMGPSYDFAELFVYDNGRTTRLTQNSIRDILPQFSNTGIVVWARRTGNEVSQILTWSQGGEVVLIEEPFWIWPDDVNDAGHFVWDMWTEDGCAGSDVDIYLYDGSGSTLLTFGDGSYQAGEISNDGHIVYTRYDFCQNPWQGDIIYLHDGVYETISGDQQYAQVPDINDAHQIVWETGGGVDYLWIWENGERRLLIDDGGVPHLNASGDVCFWRWFDDVRWFHSYALLGGRTFRLTFDGGDHFPDGINDFREVVIRVDYDHGFTGDLFLLRRVRNGDFDFDGRVNLADHERFAHCLSGPDWYARGPFDPTVTICDCRFLDLDEDGDVDMKDFAAFQNQQVW